MSAQDDLSDLEFKDKRNNVLCSSLEAIKRDWLRRYYWRSLLIFQHYRWNWSEDQYTVLPNPIISGIIN